MRDFLGDGDEVGLERFSDEPVSLRPRVPIVEEESEQVIVEEEEKQAIQVENDSDHARHIL